MAKKNKFGHKLPEKETSGPETKQGPQKKKGNPTKNGQIFGKWHKPKLG